jgi:hypothetical protein
MAHWQRPDPKFASFEFKQPYAKGLERLKRDVLGKAGFDPATLWQWGTMQGMAVVAILKACERAFGADGQKVVGEALQSVGLDIGRQILDGVEKPADLTKTEFMSFYATVINCIAYASLERPKIDGASQVSFDILWCPHQDHYAAMDCRVQRYFVAGMLQAAREFWGPDLDTQVRFDTTIPSGSHTCHFTMWEPSGEDKQAWRDYTQKLERKALAIAKEPRGGE